MPRKLTEATLGQAFVGQAAVVFIWTTIPYRMEWRYGLAAHKVIALDAGHVCQNLYLACEAIGAGTCAVAAYHQQLMDRLVRVDGQEEFVIYLAPVGKVSSLTSPCPARPFSQWSSSHALLGRQGFAPVPKWPQHRTADRQRDQPTSFPAGPARREMPARWRGCPMRRGRSPQRKWHRTAPPGMMMSCMAVPITLGGGECCAADGPPAAHRAPTAPETSPWRRAAADPRCRADACGSTPRMTRWASATSWSSCSLLRTFN